MNISTNRFSKTTFNKSSNSWASNITKSSNSFAKTAFNTSADLWYGPNTSETPYGVDDQFGGPDSTYGTTPYTGMSHFLLRDSYEINHT